MDGGKMTNKKRLGGLLSVLIVIALMAGSMFVSACGNGDENGDGTAGAKNGDTVKVLYTGTLDDGEVFDSSELHGGEPLEFTIGEAEVIPGFDQAVIGMSVGESKTVRIPADEAYGPHSEEWVFEMGWDQFPEGFQTEVGAQLQMQTQDGQVITVTVVDVSESGVTIDANPPLAGKDLTFEIELVEIVTE